MRFLNLSEGTTKESYIIEEIKTDNITKTRLQVLGVIKGTKIEILNKRINGSIIIKVRGTRLGIDKEISNSIYVKILHNERKKSNEDLKPCFYR